MATKTKVEILLERVRGAIARNVRSKRAGLNITGDELARRSNLSRATISRMENEGDRSPSLEKLCALAVALGVAPSKLLEGE